MWGLGWVDQGGRQNKRTKLKMKWEGAVLPSARHVLCECCGVLVKAWLYEAHGVGSDKLSLCVCE